LQEIKLSNLLQELEQYANLNLDYKPLFQALMK